MTIEELIIKHEGLRLKPYRDTVGKLTIGVGRNLDDKGISKEEALLMLVSDLKEVEEQLSGFSWFSKIDAVRKDVLRDMCFNMGINRLLGFSKMITAIYENDYAAAANEMLKSKWAEQVGNRAVKLSAMMKTGKYQ